MGLRLDVVIVPGLAGMLIGEVDLDKHVFGVKIIATRFFVDAVGLHALRDWRQLWFSGLDALGHPWGRVFLAAVLISVGRRISERAFGRVAGFPKSFLEESWAHRDDLIRHCCDDRLQLLSHEFETPRC